MKTGPSQATERSSGRALAAVVLAAGKGLVHAGDAPKVAVEVAGRPMVRWVVDALREAGVSRLVLVVGYGAEKVRAIFAGDDADVEYVVQEAQLGTGHAVRCAERLFEEAPPTDVLVLAGDGPLVRADTIRALCDRHRLTRAAATLATSIIDDPTGYGRVIRDDAGRFEAIVEHRNATPEQRAVREVYPSYACFDAAALFEVLATLAPDGVSGEYYVTDVPRLLRQAGRRVEVIDAVPPEDVLSINTPEQLAEVGALLTARLEAVEPVSAADRDHLKIFAGSAGRGLATTMCEHLDLPVADGQVERFPDGELIVKVDEDVRGRDCFVVQSTCEPVNENLVELLVYIDCLRRASAKRITAVIPYFGYARQDRKDEGRTPITAKLVANLITAAGADRVLCMDLHAAQIQGFFDIPVDHLSSAPVFGSYFETMREELGELVLVSPDVGNVKVAATYAEMLGAELAIIDKRRQSGTEVLTKTLIGSVKDRSVLMVDDMISTAGTICEAAKLVVEQGARSVIAAATHPVLVGMAMSRLNTSPIDRVVISDTIPDGERLNEIRGKIVVLTVARLLGDAVHRIHHDQSVSAPFRSAAGTKR